MENMSKTTITTQSPVSQPPWQVLILVAHYVDPVTIAKASCVCKSWLVSMSSDHVWQSICTKHFPSFSNLKHANPSLSYHRLYSMAFVANKRRVQGPPKPRISLNDLVFVIQVGTNKDQYPIINITKPGNSIAYDPGGVFRFDIDVNTHDPSNNNSSTMVSLKEVHVRWHVVVEGWRGVFTMMDCKGKLRFSDWPQGWFSEELPLPVCCLSTGNYEKGVVADMKLGFCRRGEGGDGDGEISVEKVSVGVMSVVNWRYVCVDDCLRYLQHFLLPCKSCESGFLSFTSAHVCT